MTSPAEILPLSGPDKKKKYYLHSIWLTNVNTLKHPTPDHKVASSACNETEHAELAQTRHPQGFNLYTIGGPESTGLAWPHTNAWTTRKGKWHFATVEFQYRSHGQANEKVQIEMFLIPSLLCTPMWFPARECSRPWSKKSNTSLPSIHCNITSTVKYSAVHARNLSV